LPSPMRAKTLPPPGCGPGKHTANLLNAADGEDKFPGKGMGHAPARRVGAALACPLTGHISKGRVKGGYGIKAPVLRIKAVSEGDGFQKITKHFCLYVQ
jgi:hypothetical protein